MIQCHRLAYLIQRLVSEGVYLAATLDLMIFTVSMLASSLVGDTVS
jgi:hypothetical protein